MSTVDLSSHALKVIRTNMAQSFKVPYKDLPRVLFHGMILASIIAGFWLLDSLKDPIVANTIGIEYQPIAKIMSVGATLFIVCIYDYLTSVVSRPTLFHIVSGFFGIATMVIAALLTHPKHGLSNEEKGPHRMLGWFAFCTIEAYGSLMVALFWSFTNSIMDLEQAKGAYGLIIATAQIGAILGSTLATNASSIGISQLFVISSVMIFSVSLLIKCYHLTFRDYITESMKSRVRSVSESNHVDPLLNNAAQALRSAPIGSSFDLPAPHAVHSTTHTPFDDAEDEVTEITEFNPINPLGRPTLLQSLQTRLAAFSEGLMLLFRYSYMIKLLCVSCLYEIVMTIMDFQFKVLGSHSKQALSHNVEAGDGFAQLLGHFGQFTNVLSFMLSFFGFSYLVHNVGVRHSLMVFPTVLFIAVIVTNLVPSMWVLFVMVSTMKAMIFSLHDPVHELLYIPTSEAIKFKVKAWIDVFGSRLAKAIGSTVCTLAGANVSTLRRTSEIPCLVLAAVILGITYNIGHEFEALIASKTFIGADIQPSKINPANHDELHDIDALTEQYHNYHPAEEFAGQNDMYGVHGTAHPTHNAHTNHAHDTNNGIEMVSTARLGYPRDNLPHSTQRARSRGHYYPEALPVRNGLKPGDVGYDGYDLHLFEGVFDEETQK